MKKYLVSAISILLVLLTCILVFADQNGSAGTTQVIPRWLLNSLAALGGVILVSLAFIVLLKRQIHRATADIQQSKAVLLESEAKFRSYIDHSPDGIFVTDENGCYLEVNPAASVITGYSQEELLKMSVFDLTPPESLKNAQHQLQTLQENDCAGSEFEFLHKNGKRAGGRSMRSSSRQRVILALPRISRPVDGQKSSCFRPLLLLKPPTPPRAVFWPI